MCWTAYTIGLQLKVIKRIHSHTHNICLLLPFIHYSHHSKHANICVKCFSWFQLLLCITFNWIHGLVYHRSKHSLRSNNQKNSDSDLTDCFCSCWLADDMSTHSHSVYYHEFPHRISYIVIRISVYVIVHHLSVFLVHI